MIIKKLDTVESFGLDDEDIIVSSLDNEQLTLFFQIFSEGFYSDPIGSIIREITSNCIDANQVSGSEEPIVITFRKDLESDDYVLEFKDNGLGMDPQFMRDVYTKFLKSTKKDDDKQIGYYGLGSKSIFAYKRSSGEKYFNIKTTVDGMTYEYIYHFVDDAPKLQLLTNFTDLVSETGTTISIDIEAKDYHNVIHKLKSQTSYFRNVFINHYNFDNDFIIYEKENYLYRNRNHYSDVIHLVYGEVPYPINFDLIGSDYRYDLPIGVKVDINNVVPTPNREGIIYDDSTIELIRLKIKRTIQEIENDFITQNSNITDLDDYLRLKKRGKELKFTNPVTGNEDYLNISKLKFKKEIVFKPLEGVTFDESYYLFSEYPVYEYYANRGNRNRNGIHTKKYTPYTSDFYNPSDTTVTVMLESNGKLNRWDTEANYEIHGYRFNVVKHKKLSFNYLCNILGLNNRRITRFNVRNIDNIRDADGNLDPKKTKKAYLKFIKEREDANETNSRYELGRYLKIYKFRKLMKDYMDSKVLSNYSILTDDEKEELIQEEKDRNRQTRVVDKTRVFYKTDHMGYRYETTIAELKEPFILFYTTDDDSRDIRENLMDYRDLLTKLRWFNKIKFIHLNKTNYGKLKHLENMIHINDFFKVNNFAKYFKNVQLAQLIYQNLKGNYNFTSHVNKISDYHKSLKRLIVDHQYTYHTNLMTRVYNDNKSHILKLIQDNKVQGNYELIQAVKEYDIICNKLDILNFIDQDIPFEYLVEIVKNKKVLKLNDNIYGKCKINPSGSEHDVSSGN